MKVVIVGAGFTGIQLARALVARGEELHVDPALFANRAQLLAFVDDPEVSDNPLAEGWRFETVGRTIIERFYVP